MARHSITDEYKKVEKRREKSKRVKGDASFFLIDSTSLLCLARTVFAHLPEWHPRAQPPVLGPERFTRRLLRKKAVPSSGQRLTITALWRQMTTTLGVPSNVLHFGGRRAWSSKHVTALSGTPGARPGIGPQKWPRFWAVMPQMSLGPSEKRVNNVSQG